MRRSHLALALGLPLVLAACGMFRGGGSTAPSVPLPNYGVGDSYRFDDGTVRRVVQVAGGQVSWRGDNGVSLVTTRDILLPPLAESTPRVTVRYQLATPGLFPLEVGRQVAFTAIAQWRTAAGVVGTAEQDWGCEVGAFDGVTTPAGSFDTVRVGCVVRPAAGGPPLQRTYFYAPSIAYVVREIDRIPNAPPQRISLVSYAVGDPALAESALLQRSGAIQLALEHKVSGRPVPWQDPVSDARGTVEPVETQHSARFGWCREFRERMQVAARQYDLLGTACREPDGAWSVQEVTPYNTASR